MKKTPSHNTIIFTIVRLVFISLIIPAYLAGICHGQEPQEQEDITIGDWFIVPGKEIPVRTGMGQQYRILAMAHSGTRVEPFEQSGIWVKVKLPDRQTGWMPFRYLTRTHPLANAVTSLKTKNQDLKTLVNRLKEQVNTLSRDLLQEQKKSKICLSEQNTLKSAHDRLRKDASNVLQIKETFQTTTAQLKETNSELSEAEQRIEQLEHNSMLKWFLSGAAVMFLGWIIGRYARAASKRRRSSLL